MDDTTHQSAYTDLKPAWHLDKIKSLRETGQCLPGQVQLVISDLCNHDCPWCAYRSEGYSSNQHFNGPEGERNPNRRIPTGKCFEIIDDIASMGIRAIQFTGGGEPTVHKDHIAIFSRALTNGLKCALVTNGNVLAEGWGSVYPHFDWIRVSLDAGTPETYASVRRTSTKNFDLAIANVTRLATSGSHVGVSFVVLKENRDEIKKAAELAKASGASSIRFAALFSTEMASYYEGWGESSHSAIAESKALLEDNDFSVIDMLGQRQSDLEQGRPEASFCGYQHLNVYIGGDQKVYRCCNTAYNDLGLVGDLSDQTFSEFWASDAKDAAYRDFDARSCEHCAFNGKNRLIRYLVDKSPTHVDFV